MRILHTADWHLGKQLHGASFLEDQACVLDDFIHLAIKDKPDCIIVAGDVYDRAIPPTEAVSLLDETLTRLVKDYKRPVIIIAGNHDSPDRLGFASTPLAESGIHLIGRYSSPISPIILNDEHGEVAICCIPYLEPAVAREALQNPELKSHEDAIRAACYAFLPRIQGKRSVLVAHAFVAGGQESDSERPLSVGGSALVPAEVFAPFQYVALGHLHQPQTILSSQAGDGPVIRYSGSLLKYSFSEVTHRKSHTIVEIASDGTVTLEAIPIVPRRDLRALRGEFKQLLQSEVQGNPEDYLIVELTNREPILDALSQLRGLYPNVLHVTKPEVVLEKSNGYHPSMQKLGDLELFKSFYEYVTGESVNEMQVKLLSETLTSLSRSERDE